MLKQTVSYIDFNGTSRTEDLYFNLTEAELVEIQVGSKEGIQKDLQEAVANKDIKQLLDFIKMLVHKSYGIKSEDGRHFRKTEAIREDFVASALYSDLLLNLFADEGTRAEKFITGLMPKDLIERAMAKTQSGAETLVDPGTGEPYKPGARELNARHIAAQNMPEATFEEAPPIGVPTMEFQAPIPPHESYTERANAAVPDAQPFRIKETPLEPGQTTAREDLAAFEAWKAQQTSQN